MGLGLRSRWPRVNGIKVGLVRYDTVPDFSPRPFLMDTPIGSERAPSPNKENTSDIIHRLCEDDREQNKAADPKVLQRATLKIDLYLIPIIGMFRVSFLPLVSPPTTNCLPRTDLLASLVSVLLLHLWGLHQ